MTLIDRRAFLRFTMLAAAGLTVAPGPAAAEAGPEILPLWPSPPPGGPILMRPEVTDAQGSFRHVLAPRLLVYRPLPSQETTSTEPTLPASTAVVVVAGGGYGRIAAGAESGPACRWLQSRGITAFELIHRLPGDGWPAEAPFEDARRAMRIVRSRAAAEGFSRIGFLGFSSGAHLAGMTAVRPEAGRRIDGIDALSARPDFAALIYPVLSMMPVVDGTGTRRALLGKNPGRRESEAMSVERQVDKGMPPVFLAQSADDPLAPIDNSLMKFTALRTAGIPAALHVFPRGGHGWGMGRAGTETAAWSALLADWLAALPVGDSRLSDAV